MSSYNTVYSIYTCVCVCTCMYMGAVFNIIHVYFICNEKRSTQNVSVTYSLIK